MNNRNALRRGFVLLAAACVPILTAAIASASIIIATVPVGNPGNAPDINGFGEVDYAYNIGEYDVTFWDGTRFANWLDNGQPTGAEGAGTTETGTYTLTPTGIANNTATRQRHGHDTRWIVRLPQLLRHLRSGR